MIIALCLFGLLGCFSSVDLMLCGWVLSLDLIVGVYLIFYNHRLVFVCYYFDLMIGLGFGLCGSDLMLV